MLSRIAIALFACLLASSAHAQYRIIGTACPSAVTIQGTSGPGNAAVDAYGNQCGSGSGGGGGAVTIANGANVAAGSTTDTPASVPTSATAATQTALLKSIANSAAAMTLSTGTPVKGVTAAMTATTSTQIIAAVATKSIYVTAIHCNNSSATATLVNIQDGSGGATLDTLAAGATFGGDNRSGPTPLFWTTAGNGLYAVDVTTGASVICQASGYSG